MSLKSGKYDSMPEWLRDIWKDSTGPVDDNQVWAAYSQLKRTLPTETAICRQIVSNYLKIESNLMSRGDVNQTLPIGCLQTFLSKKYSGLQKPVDVLREYGLVD